MGVNHTGAVDAVLGSFLGGHISGPSQSCAYSVEVILKELAGGIDVSRTLSNCILAADRGYALTKTIRDYKMKIIKTVKRSKITPFTFDRAPVPGQILIPEKGARLALWKIKDGGSGKMHHLGYRSGLGRACMLETNIPDLGAGHWAIIFYDNRQKRYKKMIYLNDFFNDFFINVIALTRTQHSQDWFTLREFRITSSVVGAMLKKLHYHDKELIEENNSIKATLALLGIATIVEEQAQEDPLTESQNVVAKIIDTGGCGGKPLVNKELVRILKFIKDRNTKVKVTGSKKDMCKAIIDNADLVVEKMKAECMHLLCISVKKIKSNSALYF